ncbi:MAG: hypothetical protein ACI8PZ_002959 [Myxococcota bacterium]
MVGNAAAQQEVCAGAFSQAEWNEALDAVDDALAELDGARADRLLDYAHHEFRCMEEVVRPADVARMAMQESVLHWYDQDPEESLRWAWTVLETLGSAAEWPEVTPARLLTELDALQLPEFAGPTDMGFVPPKGGAYLRNGFLLVEPRAPVRAHGLVQVVDKKGVAQETRWQDGAAFDEGWFGPAGDVPTPRWYEAPPPPVNSASGGVAARDPAKDVPAMRWDIEPECVWKGQPRRVVSTAGSVTINRQQFEVRGAEEQREFLRTLRTCGEFRAARRFTRWREARRKLVLNARSYRDSMEKALLTPEPTRRKRRGAAE